MQLSRMSARRFARARELRNTFTSLEEWQRWSSHHPEIFDRAYVRSLVAYGLGYGIRSRFLGRIRAQEIVVRDANYRESFLARGLNPRLRAVLDLLAEYPPAADVWNITLYAPEALTACALLLRGRFPRFVGSEYAQTDEQRRRLFPVPCEDLLDLTYPSGAFDVVISNEVFEHVPDLPRALAEVARVLKPGGLLLATFPFLHHCRQTVIKASLSGGVLHFLEEPEYHGNPVDPTGSLVFQVPGWDVLTTCRASGFRHAFMEFVSSFARGITGTCIAGIHVLRAVR